MLGHCKQISVACRLLRVIRSNFKWDTCPSFWKNHTWRESGSRKHTCPCSKHPLEHHWPWHVTLVLDPWQSMWWQNWKFASKIGSEKIMTGLNIKCSFVSGTLEHAGVVCRLQNTSRCKGIKNTHNPMKLNGTSASELRKCDKNTSTKLHCTKCTNLIPLDRAFRKIN